MALLVKRLLLRNQRNAASEIIEGGVTRATSSQQKPCAGVRRKHSSLKTEEKKNGKDTADLMKKQADTKTDPEAVRLMIPSTIQRVVVRAVAAAVGVGTTDRMIRSLVTTIAEEHTGQKR